MEGIRTVYATNNGMDPGVATADTNDHQCAVAIATTSDTFSVHVIGPIGSAYAVISRAEATAIRDALAAELERFDA